MSIYGPVPDSPASWYRRLTTPTPRSAVPVTSILARTLPRPKDIAAAKAPYAHGGVERGEVAGTRALKWGHGRGPYHELGAREEKCIRWVGPRYPPCLFSPARFATIALSRPIALEPSDQSSELSGSCGVRNRGLHLRVNLRKGGRSICRGLEARAKTKEFARLTVVAKSLRDGRQYRRLAEMYWALALGEEPEPEAFKTHVKRSGT